MGQFQDSKIRSDMTAMEKRRMEDEIKQQYEMKMDAMAKKIEEMSKMQTTYHHHQGAHQPHDTYHDDCRPRSPDFDVHDQVQ